MLDKLQRQLIRIESTLTGTRMALCALLADLPQDQAARVLQRLRALHEREFQSRPEPSDGGFELHSSLEQGATDAITMYEKFLLRVDSSAPR